MIADGLKGSIMNLGGSASGAGSECPLLFWASQVTLVVKNLPVNAGDIRDPGSIPGLGRSPGRGNGNLLQYSCLGNPMARGAWWVTVNRVTRVRQDLVTKLPSPKTYKTNI